MIKTIQLITLFSSYSIKASLQSQLGVFFFFMGKLLRFIIFFMFVYYLLTKTKLLVGYTLNQTVIFFLTYNFIDNLSQLLFREVYRFRGLIVNGELDTILIKPYHPFVRVLVGGFDIMDFILLFPFTLLLIFFIQQAGLLQIQYLLPYILLLINAMVIMTALHILVLAFGIFTTEVDHTIFILRDLTKMASFPIDIYKDPLKSILTFVVPVAIMMSVPVKALIGVLSLPLMIYSFCIAIVLLSFSLYIWKKALQKYQSWGG